MSIFSITVAYCPAPLLGRLFVLNPDKIDYVVLGHYPINKKKNNNDIKLLCEAANVKLLDPGSDLGSAQSQNWCLSQIGIKEEDYFINLDPDSAVIPQKTTWDASAQWVLNDDQNCVLISCWSPLVERTSNLKDTQFELKEIRNIKYGIPTKPTPFNLSMWRYSFIKEIGGIPQLGLMWGETESVFWAHCHKRGKYHAYLMDYIEDESGKHMQDLQHSNYKDDTLRVSIDQQFHGTFTEYLTKRYPELLKLDTCRDLSDFNFP